MVLADLLDLVLPRSCAGCDAPGAGLCADCRLLLGGRPLGLVRPEPCPAGLPPLATMPRAGHYRLRTEDIAMTNANDRTPDALSLASRNQVCRMTLEPVVVTADATPNWRT